jgi:hypothetical protein
LANAASEEIKVKQRSRRRIGNTMVWLVVIGVLTLTVGVGTALATEGGTAGWPAAKAQWQQQEQARMAEARLHAPPKPSSPQSAGPAHTPDPERHAGIDNDMHQGPFPAMEFAVRNFWQGPVGPNWVLVYAGAKLDVVDGRTRQGALRLYSATRNAYGVFEERPLGTFLAPSGTGDLTITAANGGVLQLRTASGATLSFDLTTHQYQ